MKKFLALLIMFAMLLSLAACGGGGGTGEGEPSEKPVKEVTVEGTELQTQLWTLVYDEEVWTYEEDDLTDGEAYCSLDIIIPTEDSYETSVEIEVIQEEVADYRESLVNNGFELEKVADGDYDTVEIGGVDMYEHTTTSWGEDVCYYLGRVEEAGASICVAVYGTYDERVDALLAGLVFTAEDIGNQDAPWPWDGEAFAAAGAQVSVGDYTVSSQWLSITEPVITFETFDHSMAVIGSTAYLVGDEKVQVFDYDGDEFFFDHEMELDDEYTYAYGDSQGLLWLSGFMSDLVAFEDESPISTTEDLDKVAIAPDGTWGISWFADSECKLLTISGDGVSVKDITFSGVDTVSHLNVDNEYIYVCGSDADYEHHVYVFDKQGNLCYTLADEDGEGLGSVTFVAQFDGGFIALDGNMRQVVLWDDQGNWLGECDDADLFETYYPWFCGGALLEDGSILVYMTEDRADGSGMELVAFKLSVY